MNRVHSAEFYPVTLDELGGWLKYQGFREVNLTYRRRPIKEYVFERKYAPNHYIRVYTGINKYGFLKGKSRKVGKDAIRVQAVYKDGRYDTLVDNQKRVHRVKGWKENLKTRIIDILKKKPLAQLDSKGVPMVLRTNKRDGSKFWGSRDYPRNKETKPFGAESSDDECYYCGRQWHQNKWGNCSYCAKLQWQDILSGGSVINWWGVPPKYTAPYYGLADMFSGYRELQELQAEHPQVSNTNYSPLTPSTFTVDEEIFPLLQYFWDAGIDTNWSCQGDDNEPFSGYIAFNNPDNDKLIIEMIEKLTQTFLDIIPTTWEDFFSEVWGVPTELDWFLNVRPDDPFPDHTLEEWNKLWWDAQLAVATENNEEVDIPDDYIPYSDWEELEEVKPNALKSVFYFNHEDLDYLISQIPERRIPSWEWEFWSAEVELEQFDDTTMHFKDIDEKIAYMLKNYRKINQYGEVGCPICREVDLFEVRYLDKGMGYSCWWCGYAEKYESIMAKGDITLAKYGLVMECPHCKQEIKAYNKAAMNRHIKKCMED